VTGLVKIRMSKRAAHTFPFCRCLVNSFLSTVEARVGAVLCTRSGNISIIQLPGPQKAHNLWGVVTRSVIFSISKKVSHIFFFCRRTLNTIMLASEAWDRAVSYARSGIIFRIPLPGPTILAYESVGSGSMKTKIRMSTRATHTSPP